MRQRMETPSWGAALGVSLLLSLPLSLRAQTCLRPVVNNATWPLNGVVGDAPPTASNPGCSANITWKTVPGYDLFPMGGSPAGTVSFAYRLPLNEDNGHLLFGFTVKQDPNFSERDKVQLIFDHDNDGTWNTGDFYVVLNIGPRLPTPGSIDKSQKVVQCNYSIAGIEVYHYINNQWQIDDDPNGTIAGKISVKGSYDYKEDAITDDLETDVWNVEVDVPFTALPEFDLGKTTPFFRMGAYVYIDLEPGTQSPAGVVLKWPSGLPDRTYFQQSLNGAPAVTPAMLAAVSLTNKCYNVKIAGTNPWRINNTVSGEYDNRINRNGGNTFSVDFDYEGPPSTTGNLPNPNGIVTLSLRPYNAYTIPQGNSWVQTRAASDVATFPHTYRVNFGDPVSPYPNNVAFLCATMTLSGFLHDDIPWDNSLNINYNYIHTSDYSQSVAIGIDSAPGLRRGDTATLLLRFVSRNDPSAIQQGALPGNPSSFAGRNQGAGRWSRSRLWLASSP